MKTYFKIPTLITKPENVKYISGFSGSFGELIITSTKKFLITDARYKEQAKKLTNPDFEIIIIENYKDDLTNLFKKNKIKTLRFESTNFSYSKFVNYNKVFPKIKLKPIQNEIDQLRMIKSDHEIELIQKSQKLNEKTLELALKFLKPGVSEKELANKIITIGLDLGTDTVSFDPIVAFGKNSSSPHYTPDKYKLKDSDIALIDMGFKLNGYCSDMSRTFLPKSANSEMINMYNLVLEAQETCLKNLRSGIKASLGDKFSRDVFKKAGLDQYFTHANGHGVGLEIHEAPSLSSKSKHKDKNITLQENMVVTVEPGLYFSGKFGIRIEDMAVITKSGIKNLTKFAK
jgi:Xaa-Pro aminopeptidase